jgi:hypothetical protein
MTRDEVMALSAEELRDKAVDLAGWKELPEPLCPVEGLALINLRGPTYYYWQRGDEYAEDPPDYPHDIAAAMELFELIPMPCGIERGYEVAYGVGPVGVFVGFGKLPLEHDEDDKYAENVWALTAPLAVTRAFVLAMSNEAH